MSRNLKELIRQMTLEEKAGLCSGADFWNTMGIERLGIPSVMMTDGPHGLRKQEGAADHLGLNKSVNAVCFPAACATASSFDVELMERMGVSRVTVRQALRLLADAGIIETRKGKGSIVSVDWKNLLDPGELKDQAEKYWRQFELSTKARRLIEPAIAKQAAFMATPEDIARLERIYENDQVVIEGPNLYVEEGRGLQSFHGCLWEIVKNPLLEPVWNAVVLPSNEIRTLPLIFPVDQELNREQVRIQHGNILEAVKNHDGEYAYFHMLVHCDWIYNTYKQYFDEFCR